MTSIQDLETVQKGLHILYSVLTISAINMVVLLLENGWNLNKHVCKKYCLGLLTLVFVAKTPESIPLDVFLK